MECIDGRMSRQDRTLIGEPVTRPDGAIVSLYRTGDKNEISIQHIPISSGSMRGEQEWYSDEEVLRLGHGNWEVGLMTVAQAGYARDFEEPIAGRLCDGLLQQLEE